MAKGSLWWMASIVALVAALAGGCAPVSREAEEAAEAAAAAATVTAAADSLATAIAAGRATATVSIPSLRVRADATADSRQVGSITEGQVYVVTGRSSDGEWFRLAIAALSAGEGWVSTNFVTVIGDITDVPVIVAPTPLPPTATPTRFLPTPTATAPDAETPAAIATEVATEEATEIATEAATEPATAEGTALPTAIPTEAPTQAPAEAPSAATAVPTATPTVLPTTTPTNLFPTATPTPQPPPAAGFARVVTDGGARLRVRAAPGADAAIVGHAYNGETYAVLETSADGAWTRIGGSTDGAGENPGGGWVATRFLLVAR